VDHLTLAEELTRTRHLEAIGGADFILNLLGQFPKVPEIDEYIKTIKRYAKRRDLMQAGQKIIRLGQDDDQDIDEAMMQAEQTLAKVVRTATGDTVVSAADAADALLSNLALIHSDQLAPRLPISLPLLSRLLRGWVLGQQTVVAAPTGVGKTTLAVHESGSLARHGYKIVYYSFEMGADEIGAKFIGWFTNTDWEQVLFGYERADNDERLYPYRCRSAQELETRIRRGQEELRDLHIEIVAATPDKYGRMIMPNATTHGVRAQLLRQIDRNGVDLWVVDNLPLIQFDESQKKERRDLLGEASMAFKNLAVETHSHCFLIHQLNRQSGQSNIRTHEHLGESKKVADNANNVLILDAPKQSGNADANEEDRTINISKRRGGRTGFLKGVEMNGATGWFSDPESRRMETVAPPRYTSHHTPPPPPLDNAYEPFEDDDYDIDF